MKFNWGTGIVITLSIFALGILYVVYRSVSEKVELVTEDYYSQELVYQDRIDEIARGKEAGAITVKRSDSDQLEIILPKKLIDSPTTYSIHFYRPDNSKLDFTEEFETDPGMTTLTIDRQVHKGKWLVKVSASSGDIKYYWEISTFL